MYTSTSHWCLSDVSPLKFNCTLSFVASILFFVGWWLMFDVLAEFYDIIEGAFVLPGIFGTLALALINVIPASVIYDYHATSFNTTRCGSLAVRTCLFVGFKIAFGTLIGATYILIQEYVLNKKELQKWPGWAIFMQNLFIFIATVLLRFRRPYE